MVIELKRGDDGSHMELQALRYAAMVATMTFDEVVETYARSRTQDGDAAPVDARRDLLQFLGQDDDIDEVEIADDVRIILAAAGFSREITTTVMWLNKFENMDIRCVKLVPYAIGGEIYIDIQQLFPFRKQWIIRYASATKRPRKYAVPSASTTAIGLSTR